MSADNALFVYQHSLPKVHYGQLCALPEVIARYAPGANQTSILREIREDIYSLEIDPETGNRILEVAPEDQDNLLRMLDWAADRSKDVGFSLLARDIRSGAAKSDRDMTLQAGMN